MLNKEGPKIEPCGTPHGSHSNELNSLICIFLRPIRHSKMLVLIIWPMVEIGR